MGLAGQPEGRVGGGGNDVVGIQQSERLRSGSAADSFGASEIVVGSIEDFEERKTEVAPGEDVDATALELMREGIGNPGGGALEKIGWDGRKNAGAASGRIELLGDREE